MMTTDHRYRRPFAYDAWANQECRASIARATGLKSDRTLVILSHIVAGQRVWLGRLDPKTHSAAIVEVWSSVDLSDCDRRLADLAETWVRFLDERPIGHPDRDVTYTNSKGETFTSAERDILDHILFHGAYHRGQIATLLGQVGAKSAETDFIQWVRLGEPVAE